MKQLGWVLFDNACGVCGRWVPSWSPTLSRIGLATTPLQADWVRERTGMSDEELLQDIRVLLNDGTVISGANAYFYCMERIWWLTAVFRPGESRPFKWRVSWIEISPNGDHSFRESNALYGNFPFSPKHRS